MKTDRQAIVWVSAGALGLLTLVVVFFVSFNTPRSISAESPGVLPDPTMIATTSLAAEVPSSPLPELVVPRLPPVDYSPGSIGAACKVNEFPPYHWYYDLDAETRRSLENSPYDSTGDWKEIKECEAALERHIYAINPYLWGVQDENTRKIRSFTLIDIDNPLTFERLFTDPLGDFARVQEVFARPECQLRQDADSNWNLNETCHAESIFNYALIMWFCYDDGVSNRTRQYYWEEDNPTPEQDRAMWLQRMENNWVRRKCETLDPNLDLQAPMHTELRQQILALQVHDYEHYENAKGMKSLDMALVELAARLGDDAAALTQSHGGPGFVGQGYKYGPLAGWFTDVFHPTELFIKHPPSVERIRQLVPLFANNLVANGGKAIKFDHEALVQHFCVPPYYTSIYDKDPVPEPPSCREIVNELRQELHDNQTFLDLIATFEEVAMRLDVYE
ncbi:MAG: hypothetical protein F4039_04805 [Gammaproteobacteria bacterium]|nr:hypothetical protein [Gammaproteobacteria bacterium]MYF54113.1 hypothetical protein [Gammaproteobacteria bacterium]MYK43390.1 hypothetical protein [Gammaproteobacteria bacterium]